MVSTQGSPSLQLATAWQLLRRYNFLMTLRILGSAAACRLSGDVARKFSATDSGARLTRQIFPSSSLHTRALAKRVFGYHHLTI